MTDSSTEKTALLEHEGNHSSRQEKWSRRDWLTAFVTLAGVVFLLNFSPNNIWTSRRHHVEKESICLTPSCVHASSEILYNLSPQYQNIDACTNFEELVCGGWRDRNDLRPDQGDAFTGTLMAENSQTLLRHILEAPYPQGSAHSHFSPLNLKSAAKSADEENFLKMKAAYDACLDEDTIKKAGTTPLMEIIHHVQELIPTSVSRAKDAKSNKAELQDAILYLYKLGVTAIAAPYTGVDDKDPDRVIVAVTAPQRIGLPAKERYLDEKIVAKYKNVLSKVLSALFPAGTYSKSTFDGVVEFEKQLAAVSPDAEDRNDVTKYYNSMSLHDADELLPQIGLVGLIKSLAPSDVEVKNVIIMSPHYMNATGALISDVNSEVLQTYFVWKVVQVLYPYVDADAVLPYKRFSNELQGKDPDSTPERWRTCVSHVDDSLGWILSRFFVEKAFSAKAKALGDQLVTDIKTLFIEKLKATKWMESKVIDLAINKVHNIIQKIGYPTKSPDIMDPSALRKYYDTVDIAPNAFFSNALVMNRFEIEHMWSALGKPVDKEEWGMTVPTVNAYYNPPGNEIVFPAGILQFPVFNQDVPQYLNYGAFASVAGHELSHAFDSTGRHYDEHGNYTDWWTNKTVAEFTKRADCFVNQYSNFSISGPDDKPLHVNGRLTLGENIADAGGVSAAFAAWKRRAAETQNQDLPGLDFFTQEQLFFVSYANWWCGKSRKETAINRIYTDPHAPKWARILGTMANSRDFLDAFKCKKKEPVCELW